MYWILISIVIFCADMIIKNMAEKKLKDTEETNYKALRLRLVRNRGAFLNVGDSNPKRVADFSLVITALTTVLFIYFLGRKGRPFLKAGLALLLGGGWNNIYDRIKRKYVVDYCGFLKTRMFFNISDVAIFIGAILIVVDEFVTDFK